MVNNIKKFTDISISDINTVGGKNASLGEMINNLNKKGIYVPNGFAVTTHSYDQFIKHNNINNFIKDALESVNIDNLNELELCSNLIQQKIISCDFPEELREEIIEAYLALCKIYQCRRIDVAVRSSAIDEDLPDTSCV
jgi:pyruvate,water dikinase